MRIDLAQWAEEIAATYPEIGLILWLEPVAGATEACVDHVCLVMKDGETVPWFAAGKGIDGLAYGTVPGRDIRGRILADVRVRRPGLRLYMNFCDARPLMFAYPNDEERVAGEEIAEARYRILYPSAAPLPPWEEFFHLWGDPAADAFGVAGRARKDA